MANEQIENKNQPAKKAKGAGGNKALRAIVAVPKRMLRAFQNTWAELKKVTWPGRKDLINYTTIVLVFMALMAVVVGVLDLGTTNLLRLIIDSR